MRIDRSKISNRCSYDQLECMLLAKKLSTCSYAELIECISNIKVWNYGKCELGLWVDVLDRLDQILEQAAKKIGKWQLNVDLPGNESLAKDVVIILEFTGHLVEHSIYRYLYGSWGHIITLFNSSNMDIILAVLGLSYNLSKRSNYFNRQDGNNKKVFLDRLCSIAESWGGVENGFGLAQCCSPSYLPPTACDIHFEYQAPNETSIQKIVIKKLNTMDKTPDLIMEELLESHNIPSGKLMSLFSRIRLACYFAIPDIRYKSIRARLQALSTLCYTFDVEGRYFYPSLVDELIDILKLEGEEYIEIKACTFKTMTAIVNANKHYFHWNNLVDSTGILSFDGLLPRITRDWINDIIYGKLDITNVEANKQFTTGILSFLYHLACYEENNSSNRYHVPLFTSCGILDSMLELIRWHNPKNDYLTYATRAVRVTDQILNNTQNTTLRAIKILINRLSFEVKLFETKSYSNEDTSKSIDYSLNNQRFGLMKSMLNLLKRLCLDNRWNEQMRNYIEDELPEVMKKIYLNPELAAIPNLSFYAMEALTNYMYSYPSRLSSMQSKGVTDDILKALTEFPLPKARDSLILIPSLLNTLSLNSSGASAVLKSNILSIYLKTLVSPKYLSAMKTKRLRDLNSTSNGTLSNLPNNYYTSTQNPSNSSSSSLQNNLTASQMSNAMLDLLKNHSSLKIPVFTAIINSFKLIVERGNSLSATLIKRNHTLKSISIEAGKPNKECEQKESSPSKSEPNSNSDEPLELDRKKDKKIVEGDENIDGVTSQNITDYIFNLSKFVEKLLTPVIVTSDSLAKTFINQGGIGVLCEVLKMPGLPFDFPVSLACASICKIFEFLSNSVTNFDQFEPLFKTLQENLLNLEVMTSAPFMEHSFFLKEYLGNYNVKFLHEMVVTASIICIIVQVMDNLKSDSKSNFISAWLKYDFVNRMSNVFVKINWEACIILNLLALDPSTKDGDLEKYYYPKGAPSSPTSSSLSPGLSRVPLNESMPSYVEALYLHNLVKKQLISLIEKSGGEQNFLDISSETFLFKNSHLLKPTVWILYVLSFLINSITQLCTVLSRFCTSTTSGTNSRRMRFSQSTQDLNQIIPAAKREMTLNQLSNLLVNTLSWKHENPSPSNQLHSIIQNMRYTAIRFTNLLLQDLSNERTNLTFFNSFYQVSGINHFFNLFKDLEKIQIDKDTKDPAFKEILEEWLICGDRLSNQNNLKKSKAIQSGNAKFNTIPENQAMSFDPLTSKQDLSSNLALYQKYINRNMIGPLAQLCSKPQFLNLLSTNGVEHLLNMLTSVISFIFCKDYDSESVSENSDILHFHLYIDVSLEKSISQISKLTSSHPIQIQNQESEPGMEKKLHRLGNEATNKEFENSKEILIKNFFEACQLLAEKHPKNEILHHICELFLSTNNHVEYIERLLRIADETIKSQNMDQILNNSFLVNLQTIALLFTRSRDVCLLKMHQKDLMSQFLNLLQTMPNFIVKIKNEIEMTRAWKLIMLLILILDLYERYVVALKLKKKTFDVFKNSKRWVFYSSVRCLWTPISTLFEDEECEDVDVIITKAYLSGKLFCDLLDNIRIEFSTMTISSPLIKACPVLFLLEPEGGIEEEDLDNDKRMQIEDADTEKTRKESQPSLEYKSFIQSIEQPPSLTCDQRKSLCSTLLSFFRVNLTSSIPKKECFMHEDVCQAIFRLLLRLIGSDYTVAEYCIEHLDIVQTLLNYSHLRQISDLYSAYVGLILRQLFDDEKTTEYIIRDAIQKIQDLFIPSKGSCENVESNKLFTQIKSQAKFLIISLCIPFYTKNPQLTLSIIKSELDLNSETTKDTSLRKVPLSEHKKGILDTLLNYLFALSGESNSQFLILEQIKKMKLKQETLTFSLVNATNDSSNNLHLMQISCSSILTYICGFCDWYPMVAEHVAQFCPHTSSDQASLNIIKHILQKLLINPQTTHLTTFLFESLIFATSEKTQSKIIRDFRSSLNNVISLNADPKYPNLRNELISAHMRILTLLLQMPVDPRLLLKLSLFSDVAKLVAFVGCNLSNTQSTFIAILKTLESLLSLDKTSVISHLSLGAANSSANGKAKNQRKSTTGRNSTNRQTTTSSSSTSNVDGNENLENSANISEAPSVTNTGDGTMEEDNEDTEQSDQIMNEADIFDLVSNRFNNTNSNYDPSNPPTSTAQAAFAAVQRATQQLIHYRRNRRNRFAALTLSEALNDAIDEVLFANTGDGEQPISSIVTNQPQQQTLFTNRQIRRDITRQIRQSVAQLNRRILSRQMNNVNSQTRMEITPNVMNFGSPLIVDNDEDEVDEDDDDDDEDEDDEADEDDDGRNNEDEVDDDHVDHENDEESDIQMRTTGAGHADDDEDDEEDDDNNETEDEEDEDDDENSDPIDLIYLGQSSLNDTNIFRDPIGDEGSAGNDSSQTEEEDDDDGNSNIHSNDIISLDDNAIIEIRTANSPGNENSQDIYSENTGDGSSQTTEPRNQRQDNSSDNNIDLVINVQSGIARTGNNGEQNIRNIGTSQNNSPRTNVNNATGTNETDTFATQSNPTSNSDDNNELFDEDSYQPEWERMALLPIDRHASNSGRSITSANTSRFLFRLLAPSFSEHTSNLHTLESNQINTRDNFSASNNATNNSNPIQNAIMSMLENSQSLINRASAGSSSNISTSANTNQPSFGQNPFHHRHNPLLASDSSNSILNKNRLSTLQPYKSFPSQHPILEVPNSLLKSLYSSVYPKNENRSNKDESSRVQSTYVDLFSRTASYLSNADESLKSEDKTAKGFPMVHERIGSILSDDRVWNLLNTHANTAPKLLSSIIAYFFADSCNDNVNVENLSTSDNALVIASHYIRSIDLARMQYGSELTDMYMLVIAETCKDSILSIINEINKQKKEKEEFLSSIDEEDNKTRDASEVKQYPTTIQEEEEQEHQPPQTLEGQTNEEEARNPNESSDPIQIVTINLSQSIGNQDARDIVSTENVVPEQMDIDNQSNIPNPEPQSSERQDLEGDSISLNTPARIDDATEPVETVSSNNVSAPTPAPRRIPITDEETIAAMREDGMDELFLDALPEDMRREVLADYRRNMRLTAQINDTNLPEHINPEWLAELPANIQEEVIAQVRSENPTSVQRQQPTSEQSGQQNQSGTATTTTTTSSAQNPPNTSIVPSVDSNTAFLSSLPPDLRREVLADMEDSQIELLPASLAEEARQLRRPQATNFSGSGVDIRHLNSDNVSRTRRRDAIINQPAIRPRPLISFFNSNPLISRSSVFPVPHYEFGSQRMDSNFSNSSGINSDSSTTFLNVPYHNINIIHQSPRSNSLQEASSNSDANQTPLKYYPSSILSCTNSNQGKREKRPLVYTLLDHEAMSCILALVIVNSVPISYSSENGSNNALTNDPNSYNTGNTNTTRGLQASTSNDQQNGMSNIRLNSLYTPLNTFFNSLSRANHVIPSLTRGNNSPPIWPFHSKNLNISGIMKKLIQELGFNWSTRRWVVVSIINTLKMITDDKSKVNIDPLRNQEASMINNSIFHVGFEAALGCVVKIFSPTNEKDVRIHPQAANMVCSFLLDTLKDISSSYPNHFYPRLACPLNWNKIKSNEIRTNFWDILTRMINESNDTNVTPVTMNLNESFTKLPSSSTADLKDSKPKRKDSHCRKSGKTPIPCNSNTTTGLKRKSMSNEKEASTPSNNNYNINNVCGGNHKPQDSFYLLLSLLLEPCIIPSSQSHMEKLLSILVFVTKDFVSMPHVNVEKKNDKKSSPQSGEPSTSQPTPVTQAKENINITIEGKSDLAEREDLIKFIPREAIEVLCKVITDKKATDQCRNLALSLVNLFVKTNAGVREIVIDLFEQSASLLIKPVIEQLQNLKNDCKALVSENMSITMSRSSLPSSSSWSILSANSSTSMNPTSSSNVSENVQSEISPVNVQETLTGDDQAAGSNSCSHQVITFKDLKMLPSLYYFYNYKPDHIRLTKILSLIISFSMKSQIKPNEANKITRVPVVSSLLSSIAHIEQLWTELEETLDILQAKEIYNSVALFQPIIEVFCLAHMQHIQDSVVFTVKPTNLINSGLNNNSGNSNVSLLSRNQNRSITINNYWHESINTNRTSNNNQNNTSNYASTIMNRNTYQTSLQDSLVDITPTLLSLLPPVSSSNSTNSFSQQPSSNNGQNSSRNPGSNEPNVNPETVDEMKHVDHFHMDLSIGGAMSPKTCEGLKNVQTPDHLNPISKFAERHRKAINFLLRKIPSDTQLIESPLVVFLQYPRLIDFDIKRRFFRQRLLSASRNSHSNRFNDESVVISRDRIFEDSYARLHRKTPNEWRHKFIIRFQNEDGQDAGGLLREWYLLMSREIFNPNYCLFRVSPADRVTYTINPSSYINSNHLSYFKFVGRFIAKAIYDNKLLECFFTRSFYKHILGVPVRASDLEAEDYDYYKGLEYLLNNKIEDLGYELTFSTEINEFGRLETRDLTENGRTTLVTEDNKKEYVRLVCQERMTGAIRKQLNSFLEGFYEIIPKSYISLFNEQELELLISGLPNIDIEDLKANTMYSKYSSSSPQIIWFWKALESFDQEDRARFLQFITGTSKVPLGGFAKLEGMNGPSKFQISKASVGTTNHLPSAHTCFNTLDLPMYETYDKLRSRLLTAIRECSEGYGLA